MSDKEKLLGALTAILENNVLTDRVEFICFAVRDYWHKNFGGVGIAYIERLMSVYKPSNNQFSEFLDSEYWLGETSWWDWDASDWEEVKEIKHRYIRQVIDVLKKELNG